jgi:ribonuclease HI
MADIILDDNDRFKVFVDGACSLKYNKGGIGVYNQLLNLNVSFCINHLFDKKTNSITELYAVKHALTLISMLNLPNTEQFTIYSDSKYVVDSLSIWIHNWKKNNWLRADKKPISHKDLIVETYDLLSDLHISIKWIPREQNTFADKLAKNSIY